MFNREEYAANQINSGLNNIKNLIAQIEEAQEVKEKIRLLQHIHSYASSYATEAKGALAHNDKQIEKYIVEIVKYLRRRKVDHNSLAVFAATLRFFKTNKKGYTRENLCWEDEEYMQKEIESRYGITDKPFYN